MTINWWTIGIQAVNVGILVWLLERFFWKPLSSMIETRRSAVAKTLGDAATTRDRNEGEAAELAQARAGIAGERDAVLVAARDRADEAVASRMTAAATEAAGVLVAAGVSLELKRKAMQTACFERADGLAVDIAERLAGRLDSGAVEAAFLSWLLNTVAALPDASRRAVVESGYPLDAISAKALDVAEQGRYRALIEHAFGGRLTMRFATDAALLAGFELRGAGLDLHNSWRADLARIRADLIHGR
jgi:F-type H+-transporting ATPase subunit b